MIGGAAFYTLSSGEYFLGAVGLVNSLRLQGHEEPIYVLDCGLEPWQRELLDAEATVVPAPGGSAPHVMKPIAPLRHPAETVVLLDADMIVTRHLGELISLARDGVVAFENNEDRWVPEWGELLGLGELEPRPYVCSAFVALGGARGREALRLFADRVDRVDVERSYFSVNLFELDLDAPEYPLALLDQDVLNAVLSAVVPESEVTALPSRGTALTPFADLEVTDPLTLRCVYGDGFEPYLLHHILPGKPWLEATEESPYSVLLRRLLCGPDLALRVPPARLPRRVREGTLARLERARGRAGVTARMFIGLWRARLANRLRPRGRGRPA